MRWFIFALFLCFTVLGYGQSAKYILDGNDEVRSEFLTPANSSILATGLTPYLTNIAPTYSSYINTFLSSTNGEGARLNLGLGTTNNVTFNSGTFNDGITVFNFGVDSISINLSNGISFGGIAPASLNYLASATRTNLGLGWEALTKTNATDFRFAIAIGQTNSVTFRTLNIASGFSYDPSTGALGVVGSSEVSIRPEGIYFNDSGPAVPGVMPSSANQTRTNLGLTWSGLTNTNASTFQTALFNNDSLNAQGQRITNLAAPVNDTDAATKAYVFGLFNRVAPTVSFANTTGTVEIGSTVSSVSLSWTISPTNTTVSSQTLTGSQGTVSAITATNRSATASTNFTSDTTWTLIVNDGTGLPGGIRTNTTSIAFRHYMSWGISASTTLDNSQIQNLHTNTPAGAGREFRTGKGKSVSISGNGQYIYFAYPASFGAASFIVNNAPNTAWISNTVTYTNASGNATSFLIYRSTDVQFGTSIPITIN